MCSSARAAQSGSESHRSPHPARKHPKTRSRTPAPTHKSTAEAWWGALISSSIHSTIGAHQDSHPGAANCDTLGHATGRADMNGRIDWWSLASSYSSRSIIIKSIGINASLQTMNSGWEFHTLKLCGSLQPRSRTTCTVTVLIIENALKLRTLILGEIPNLVQRERAA